MTGDAIRARHRALPYIGWPTADQVAWVACCRQGDFLEPGGRGAAWRPASRRSGEGAYGRWLAWLATQQVDLALEAPADRFTVERMRAYLGFVGCGRAPVTVVSCLGVLIMVVSALFPECDWRWLRTAHARLKRRAKPVREKAERLVPARDLRQLGLDLMANATAVLDDSSGGASPIMLRKAARDFRDGLVIALLALRQLRVSNLLAIEIGTQLRRASGRSTLQFTAEETKQHDVFSAHWPPDLEAALERYLSDVRPRLVAADPPGGLGVQGHSPRPPGVRLWVAQGGTPLTPAGLRKAVARHTRRKFGKALCPHLFRDCAATTTAEEMPNEIHHAARLLGHATVRTTERSYIAAGSDSALARHHELISSIRKRAASKAKCRREHPSRSKSE